MKNKFILFFIITISTNNSYTAQTIKSSSIAQSQQSHFDEIVNQFFNVFPDPSIPENALLPSLEKEIDLIYKTTLGVPQSVALFIKKFYSYMQQEVVDKELNQIITSISNINKKLGTALKEDPDIKKMQAQLITLEKSFITKKAELDKNIIDLCLKSNLWQQHLKMFIADSYNYESTLLKSVHEQEKEIFNYLPTFETAYYSEGYTTIRKGSELVRMFLVLTDNLRSRALENCTDWKNITNTDDLYEAVKTFKASNFYTTAHAFNAVGSSTKTYALQKDNILNKDGTISKGFNKYFGINNIQNIVPKERMVHIVGVDENGNPYLTALGNLLFTFQPASSQKYATLSHNKIFYTLFKETPEGMAPLPLYMELLGLSAIKFLNAQINYLFNSVNLENSIKSLEKINTKTFPTITPYQPEDYIWLKTINTLTPEVKPSLTDGTTVQSFFKHLFHSIKHAFKSVGHDIKTIVYKTGDVFKDVGEGIKHLATGIYYESGIGALVNHISYSESQKRAGKMFNAVASDIQDAGKNITDIVNATANIAKTTLNEIGTVTGSTLGAILHDPTLGKDFSGVLNAFSDAFINLAKDSTDLLVETGISTVRLTYEAVNIIASTVWDLSVGGIAAGASGGNPFKNLTEEGSYFIKDVITSILQTASLIIKEFTDGLKSLMQGVAYITSAITDIIADISGTIGALNALTHGDNAGDAFKKWKEDVNEHQRLIVGIVTTTVVVAATLAPVILSGGSGLAIGIGVGAAALGAGLSAISVIGDNQKDQTAEHQRQHQTAFLNSYKKYVSEDETVVKVFEKLTLAELSLQFESQNDNQEKNLVFFQNYINSNFNKMVSESSYTLGSFYNQFMDTDTKNGLSPADPGYLYGIKTDRMNMNPSQGFLTFNKQRNSFSQEIASAPTQISQQQNNISLGNQSSLSKFWLQQKDLSNIPKGSPLEVEVRWRSIYEVSDAFYIGLFVTEKSLNQNIMHALNKNYQDALQIQGNNAQQYHDKTWKNLDQFNRELLDFDSLSRSFVFFREDGNNTPKLGFYQHEGLGWSQNTIAPLTYQRGVWYRMKVRIIGKQTSVKCWEEGSQEPNWQKTFTTDPARYMSDIQPIPLPKSNNVFSITTQKNTENPLSKNIPTATIAPKKTDSWKLSNQTNLGIKTTTPQGSWKLSESNQVIDNSEKWNLSTIKNSSPYSGSFGVISSGAAVEYEILSPKNSIETTKERKKNDISIKSYIASQGSPLYEVDREKEWIKTVQLLEKPSFGNYKLTSTGSIAQGIYLYKMSNTLFPEGVSDYVVFASSINTSEKTASGIGISPLSKPKAIVSLINGNAYNKEGTIISQCSGVLTTFENNFPLSESEKNGITSESKKYFNLLSKPIQLSNITLTPINNAFQNSNYIYSGEALSPLLKNKTDYYVTASLTKNNTYISYGKLLENKDISINGVISLITGNVYGFFNGSKRIADISKNQHSSLTLQPLTKNSFYSTLYSSYEGHINITLFAKIKKAANDYQIAAEISKEHSLQTAPPVKKPVSQPAPSHSIFWELTHGNNQQNSGPSNNFNALIDSSSNNQLFNNLN